MVMLKNDAFTKFDQNTYDAATTLDPVTKDIERLGLNDLVTVIRMCKNKTELSFMLHALTKEYSGALKDELLFKCKRLFKLKKFNVFMGNHVSKENHIFK